MKNFVLAVCYFALIVFSSTCHGEIVITINSIQDLINHGFNCDEGEVEVNSCRLQSAVSAAALPPYFPDSYRTLTGNNFLYVTSANESISQFALRSYDLPINRLDYVMIKMEYYTETTQTHGYMVYWADAGIGFFNPAENSEWKTDFTKSVIRASFEQNELSIFLTNDKAGRLGVFRKIEIIINPTPQIDIEITNVEEFAWFGASCPNCRLGSAPTPQELPDYFPPGFHSLPATSGNSSVMWVDFSNTLFPTLILTDLANFADMSCTGYVDLEPEYYMEAIGSFGWGKTYNSWSTYGVSEPSEWTMGTGSFFHLYYYLMQGNTEVGFHSMNSGLKMAVFRKLGARIYYYPQEEVACRSIKEIDADQIYFENSQFSRLVGESKFRDK